MQRQKTIAITKNERRKSKIGVQDAQHATAKDKSAFVFDLPELNTKKQERQTMSLMRQQTLAQQAAKRKKSVFIPKGIFGDEDEQLDLTP